MAKTESNAPKIVISLLVMTGVSLLFVALRLICKARYRRKLGWDDHLLSASWLCLVVYSTLIIVATSYGIGRHIVEIPRPSLMTALELNYIGRFFAIIALAVSKSSFAVTLLQVAQTTWQRQLIWFIIISLNIVMWLCGFSLFVQCSPIERGWDQSVRGSCWAPQIQVSIGIAAGAYSALMDFMLAFFPFILIRKVQLRKKEKFGVIFAMSLGVFAGIAAIIKSYFITFSGRDNDFTFSSANLLIISASETAVTIVAASIPILRLFFKEVSQKSRFSSVNDLASSRRTMPQLSRKTSDDGADTLYGGADPLYGEVKRVRLVYQEDGRPRLVHV